MLTMPDKNNDKGLGGHQRAGRFFAWLMPALALSGVLIAYGPALHGPLFFDDSPNLLDNPLVQIGGAQFDEWRIAVLSNDSGALHRPAAMLTFTLNFFLVGDFTSFSLKATNLVLHLLNGLLLYWLCAAALRAPAVRHIHDFTVSERFLIAVFAATIWLLHPLHVSTVLYAVQRMAILSTFFTLAGLVVYLRYRLRSVERFSAGESVALSLWLLVFTGLAVLSKENGALLPWLVIVLEVTLFRGEWGGRTRTIAWWSAWLLLVLPAVALALATLLAPSSLPGNFSGREFNLEERLLTQGRAMWLYLQWLAIPDITQMGFFHDDIPLSRSFWSPLSTGIALIAWAAVVVLALAGCRRFPLLSLAFLFYLVGHSMESTVLPLELFFEHRNYLPSAGFALLAAVGLMLGTRRMASVRYAPIASVVLLLLSTLLLLRAHAWSDAPSLARANVVNHPDSARANFFYALTLTDEFREVQGDGNEQELEAALAVAARTHYLRMYELDSREIAGIVMLYQFDTLHFPDAAERQDWLGVLDTLVAQRSLHTSDLDALGALADFVSRRDDALAQLRVYDILATLVERYPHNAILVEDLYLLHKARGGDTAEMLPLLERTVRLNTRNTKAASHLVGHHAGDDPAAAVEALREWIRRDSLRRQLPVFKQLLGP